MNIARSLLLILAFVTEVFPQASLGTPLELVDRLRVVDQQEAAGIVVTCGLINSRETKQLQTIEKLVSQGDAALPAIEHALGSLREAELSRFMLRPQDGS